MELCIIYQRYQIWNKRTIKTNQDPIYKAQVVCKAAFVFYGAEVCNQAKKQKKQF